MYKRIRIVIPVIQVLAMVCVQIWEKVTGVEKNLLLYVLPTRHMVMDMNFPLAMIWWPITHTSELSSNYFPLVRFSSGMGMVQVVVAALFATTLYLSIALFWYFVVTELWMRTHGKSLVRFSNRIAETIKVFVLFLCGLGTFAYACREVLLPFLRHWTFSGLWPVEITASVLFLVAWGIIFVGFAIEDFRTELLSNRVPVLPS